MSASRTSERHVVTRIWDPLEAKERCMYQPTPYRRRAFTRTLAGVLALVAPTIGFTADRPAFWKK